MIEYFSKRLRLTWLVTCNVHFFSLQNRVQRSQVSFCFHRACSQKLIRFDRQSSIPLVMLGNTRIGWKKNSKGGLPQCDICQQVAPGYSHDLHLSKFFSPVFFSFSFLFGDQSKNQKAQRLRS